MPKATARSGDDDEGGSSGGSGGSFSFFSPAMIANFLAFIVIIAITVYFYRSNQDLVNKIAEQQKIIEGLKNDNALLNNKFSQLYQTVSQMQEAMQQVAKKRKGTEKRIGKIEEDLYELSEQVSSGSVDGNGEAEKKGKKNQQPNKKTGSRDSRRPSKKSVRVKDDETTQDEDEDDDEDLIEYQKTLKKQPSGIASLV